MNEFLDYLLLREPNIVFVVLGSILIGLVSGLIGTFTFLKKTSLVGDAIAHATLPGVCLAFIYAQEKNTLILLLGSFLSGWIGVLMIDRIRQSTKLKNDTAIALVLSLFFGVGIFLLTIIQQSGNADQSGLNQFLTGQAAAIRSGDLYIFAVAALIMISITILFYEPLRIMIFNRDYAISIGLPVKTLDVVLNSATVLAIAVGIQTVGVILMAALLIGPAAAARFWTYNLQKMLLIAAFVGAFAGWIGGYVSYTAPNMPTGPWIVTVLSLLAIGSALFAPRTGMVSRMVRQSMTRHKIRNENILKTLYQVKEKTDLDPNDPVSFEEIQNLRYFPDKELKKGVARLENQNFLILGSNGVSLTQLGWEESVRVVRLHRLWEMYLHEKMNLSADHIHPNAESMEHIITPEIEKLLIKELNDPRVDPHQSVIPSL